jgi:hypothetical protein
VKSRRARSGLDRPAAQGRQVDLPARSGPMTRQAP